MIRPNPKYPLAKSLLFKMGIWITFFIILIETVLLVTTYMGKEQSVRKTQDQIVKKISTIYNIEIPKGFCDEIIYGEMGRFVRNVVLMVLLIIVVVVSGTLVIFHFVVGRPIKIMYDANLLTSPENWHKIPEELIPNDELGLLMKSRNEMMLKLESMTSQLMEEKQIRAVEATIGTFNHEINNPLSIIYGHLQLYEPQDEKSKDLVKTIEKNMTRIIEANKKLTELKKIVFTNFEKDLSLLTLENLEESEENKDS